MKNIKEKSPWKGCLFYLVLICPAFIFVRWEIATSIAVLITTLMFMYGGIEHEIKKMRKLKNTVRTVISNTPKYGYVKIVGKVKPIEPSLTTLLTNEQADYRWVSFQYAYTNEKREADGTSRYESGWSSFYDDETNLKILEIYDGTGSCYLGLHHAHYYINYKTAEYTATEFLQFLKDKDLKEVPVETISKEQKVRIVERWIKKDQKITFYGTMNKLPLQSVPIDLMEAANKALKYGPDDDTRKRDRQRILNKDDWKMLINSAKEAGDSTLDIITCDYTNTAENELVLNAKNNSALNTNSYIAICAYLFGAVVFILVWYGFVNSEYPEFFEQFR